MVFILFENKSNVDGKFLVGKGASWYCQPETHELLWNIGTSGDIPNYVKKGDSYLYIGKNINLADALHFEKFYGPGVSNYAYADKPWLDGIYYNGAVNIVDDNTSFYKVTFTGGTERKLNKNEIPNWASTDINWYAPEGYSFTVTKESMTDAIFSNYGRVIFEKIMTKIKYANDSSLWPPINIPSYTAWDKFWKTNAYKAYLAAVDAQNRQNAEKAAYEANYVRKLNSIAAAIRECGLYNN